MTYIAKPHRPRRASLLVTSLLGILSLGGLMLTAPAASAAPLESYRGSFSDKVVTDIGFECGFSYDVEEDGEEVEELDALASTMGDGAAVKLVRHLAHTGAQLGKGSGTDL